MAASLDASSQRLQSEWKSLRQQICPSCRGCTPGLLLTPLSQCSRIQCKRRCWILRQHRVRCSFELRAGAQSLTAPRRAVRPGLRPLLERGSLWARAPWRGLGRRRERNFWLLVSNFCGAETVRSLCRSGDSVLSFQHLLGSRASGHGLPIRRLRQNHATCPILGNEP